MSGSAVTAGPFTPSRRRRAAASSKENRQNAVHKLSQPAKPASQSVLVFRSQCWPAGAASPDRAGACAQNANTTIARIGWHQAWFAEKAASCIARTFVVKCWAHLPADYSVVGSLRTLALPLVWPWQRFGVGRRCTETDAAPSARAAGNSHACSPRQSRLRRLSGAPQRPECRGEANWPCSFRGEESFVRDLLEDIATGNGRWQSMLFWWAD